MFMEVCPGLGLVPKGIQLITHSRLGGYFFGSVDEHRYQLQRHARKLKARVFARMESFVVFSNLYCTHSIGLFYSTVPACTPVPISVWCVAFKHQVIPHANKNNSNLRCTRMLSLFDINPKPRNSHPGWRFGRRRDGIISLGDPPGSGTPDACWGCID